MGHAYKRQRLIATHISVLAEMKQTRRERLKSAPHLRLKMRKRFFWKKIEIF